MIQISDELFKELKDKWIELYNSVNYFYGTEYPDKCDKDGWKLRGLKEGLGYAINKIEREQDKTVITDKRII